MNIARLIAALAIAAAVAPAFAAPPSDAPQGKTRAQVHAELIQAYRDGTIPIIDSDYPPSPATIELNRERFAAENPPWAAEAQ